MAFNSIQEFIDHCRDEVLRHGAIKKDYLRSFFEILGDKGSIEKLRGISSPFLKLQFKEFETLLEMVNFVLTSKAVAVEVDGVLIMHNVAEDLADEEYIMSLKEGWLDDMKVTPTLNKWNVSDNEKVAIKKSIDLAPLLTSGMSLDEKIALKKAIDVWESLPPGPTVEEPKSTIVYIEIPQ